MRNTRHDKALWRVALGRPRGTGARIYIAGEELAELGLSGKLQYRVRVCTGRRTVIVELRPAE